MTAKKTSETAPTVEHLLNKDCFIIMPIAENEGYNQGHFKRVYEDIFAPACEAAGYRPVRADDVVKTNLIHLDILKKLLESPMAICDLSTRNPNVLFELGLRQAFDMPTVLVQEEGTPPIFDISMLRYTTYSKTLDYRLVLADQERIKEVLIETGQSTNDSNDVNSIIKLLSITKPAKLDDPSKFGEKQYFDLLMNEIKGLKNTVGNLQKSSFDSRRTNTVSENISFNQKIAKKHDEYLEFKLDISPESTKESLRYFFQELENFPFLISKTIKKNENGCYSVNLKIDHLNDSIVVKQVNEIADKTNVKLDSTGQTFFISV